MCGLPRRRGREADAISRLSATLSRTQTTDEAVESVLDEGESLLEPDALLLARVDVGWGVAHLLPGLLATGLGLGLATTPITMAAMEHVSAERSGIAGATMNASGMVGMSLGIVLMGAIVSAR